LKFLEGVNGEPNCKQFFKKVPPCAPHASPYLLLLSPMY
jgi:hypothetical protein